MSAVAMETAALMGESTSEAARRVNVERPLTHPLDYGEEGLAVNATRKDIERFWTKVTKAGRYECWPFTGALDADGYGTFWINGATRRAPRVAWVIANERAIPDGLIVRHRCDNPPCVNPAHLLIGTRYDNDMDRVERGRSATGDRHSSRLYPERIRRGPDAPNWRTGGSCPHGHAPDRSRRLSTTGEWRCRECGIPRDRAYRARLRERPDWDEHKRERNARDRAKYAASKAAKG